jgi:hypothetical protein
LKDFTAVPHWLGNVALRPSKVGESPCRRTFVIEVVEAVVGPPSAQCTM